MAAGALCHSRGILTVLRGQHDHNNPRADSSALRNNPGLNSARIASMIGMTTKKISGTVSTLLADGLIEFEGKHGQRLYRLTDYGMKYAPETIPAMPKGNSKLVQRTEANVICQECRNSAAMRRILSVYGVRA